MNTPVLLLLLSLRFQYLVYLYLPVLTGVLDFPYSFFCQIQLYLFRSFSSWPL